MVMSKGCEMPWHLVMVRRHRAECSLRDDVVCGAGRVKLRLVAVMFGGR